MLERWGITRVKEDSSRRLLMPIALQLAQQRNWSWPISYIVFSDFSFTYVAIYSFSCMISESLGTFDKDEHAGDTTVIAILPVVWLNCGLWIWTIVSKCYRIGQKVKNKNIKFMPWLSCYFHQWLATCSPTYTSVATISVYVYMCHSVCVCVCVGGGGVFCEERLQTSNLQKYAHGMNLILKLFVLFGQSYIPLITF